ncbi:MAG: hypothetical protein QM679_11885 [Patulibacter sp.]
MTYDPAGAPLDPARGEQLVATAEGVVAVDAVARVQPARPVRRRATLPAPVKAAAIGGAGVAAGLALAALLPGRSGGRRVIVAPAPGRRKRRLRTKQTTSVLVDLHLLER